MQETSHLFFINYISKTCWELPHLKLFKLKLIQSILFYHISYLSKLIYLQKVIITAYRHQLYFVQF